MTDFTLNMTSDAAITSAKALTSASRKVSTSLVLTVYQALEQFKHKNNAPILEIYGNLSGREVSKGCGHMAGHRANEMKYLKRILENTIDGTLSFKKAKGKLKINLSPNGGVNQEKLNNIAEVLKMYRGKIVSGSDLFNDLFPAIKKNTVAKIDVERRGDNASKDMNVKELDALIEYLAAMRKTVEQKPAK